MINTANTSAKFNKAEIFTNAWTLVKMTGKSLSEALKAAWANAKAPKAATQIICNLANTGRKLDVEVVNGKFFVQGHEISVMVAYGTLNIILQLKQSYKNSFSLVGNVEDSVFAAAYAERVSAMKADKGMKGVEVSNRRAGYSDAAALREMGCGL